MSTFIKAIFISSIFMFGSYTAQAEFFVLKADVQQPPPTTFATVDGVIGLGSEVITSGTLTIRTDNYSESVPLDNTGNFSVQVASGKTFTINASLSLEGLPAVNVDYGRYDALTQDSITTLNLSPASGRVQIKFNITGGSAETLDIDASSSAYINNLSQDYSYNGDVAADTLLALPAGIAATVGGDVYLTTDSGCKLKEQVPTQTITPVDSEISGNAPPQQVEWTIDLTNRSCNPVALSGNFRLDGLNDSITLSAHEMRFSGQNFVGTNTGRNDVSKTLVNYVPNLGIDFEINPIIEDYYSVTQKSSFSIPDSSLTLPADELTVSNNTIYNSIHSIGTSHGSLQLAGSWNLSDVETASANAKGTTTDASPKNMSANGVIDTSDGSYDFVMAVGDWQIYNYDFDFISPISNRNYDNSLNVNLRSEILAPRFNIVQGQPRNLTPVPFQTATAQVELRVEQADGLPAPVTINYLNVRGSGSIIDPVTSTVLGSNTISSESSGTDESSLLITLYGLAGTYNMTAIGYDSDRNRYSVSFPLTLVNSDTGTGGGDPTEPPEPGAEGSMACYGINKVKLYQREKANKDKLYIKYAAFRLPENAEVDLSTEDVYIMVDSQMYQFPAGSFKQKGNKQKFEFKSASGEKPHIKATLDFEKAEWGLKVNHADIDDINNIEDVDVRLIIGTYEGSEKIQLESKNKHNNKLMYKRKPKVSCRLGKYNSDDDDDDDDDEDDDD